MGYLNNSVTVLDAILTKKGRELMARNNGSFKITQFALSDDEIDYTLYNPNHPSGSAYYGEAIENLPLLEAFADENQNMKYKLVSLPRGTARMPFLDIGYPSIVLNQGASLSITPQTLNYIGTNNNEPSGYSMTISDIRLFSLFEGMGLSQVPEDNNGMITLGTNMSKTVIGTTFNLKATTINALFGTNDSLYATLYIIGRDSGARITIPVTINKLN